MHIQFPAFEHARLLVVGDVMLDRYWQGATQRISPEAPVPVVNINHNEEKPGGAANVALNIAALNAYTSLLGIVGNDAAAVTLEEKLLAAQVVPVLLRSEFIPTITKLRVISLHQQLIRLDFEDQITPHQQQDALFNTFQRLLAQNHAIILSDYSKGTLCDAAKLIAAARQQNIPVFVDPKGQDFSIYRGATILTPNRREFEQVVGVTRTDADLVTRGEKLCAEYALEGLLVTRGAEGMTLIRRNQAPIHLHAHASEVYDVTGAGDTVIAVLASSIAAGETWETAIHLANIAAGIVVTKLGAASVAPAELRRALREQQDTKMGILSVEEAVATIHDAKAQHEKIVMTNGCFDILHPGHISYLESAKALGDRLIIAVNDDDSVKRLKGAERPINSLDHRMALLAALRPVDWVVSFSEDTPAQLIEKLQPDVLVKGGDYRVEEIAGADFVLKNGGEVKILEFVPNQSSSAIIAKIRGEK